MKGFCLLLMVALAICGPPAIAGHSDYLTSQSIDQNSIDTGPVTIAENPATAPALAQVVQDPGSCDGQFAQLAITLNSFTDNASHAADQQRWRCRLLIRSACC